MFPIRRLAACLSLALLVTAGPAAAQRMSLADRVTLLEQRAANNQSQVDLLNQVNQLKSEMQGLRAQVEELSQEVKQLKQASRAQYLDLDGRINRLEGGSGGGAAPAAGAVVPGRGTPTAPAAAAGQLPTPPRAAEKAPSVYGDRGAVATQSAEERSGYDQAFAALKAGQYADSARLFHAFLQRFPNGVYTPNARYWLGESYYVTGNYKLALEQFQALLDGYPTHDKAAGALLKVGLAQLGLKQNEAAEKTLAAVNARFPGTDAARTATDRLQAMQLGKVR